MKRFSRVLGFILTLLLVATFANGLVEASQASTNRTITEHREQHNQVSISQGEAEVVSVIPKIIDDQCDAKNDTFTPTDKSCLKVIPIPTPELVDTCGPDNAFWKATDTNTVDWSINQDAHLIAIAKPGFIFEGGLTTIDFGKAVDSNEPCVIPVPTPELVDTCGPDNAFWKATDTDTVDWSINQNLHLIAAARPGFIFEGGLATIDFGKAVDSNEPCPVTP